MLNSTEIAVYKQKLEEELRAIKQEMKELEKAPDFGHDVSDPNEEEADEAEEYGVNQSIEEQLRVRAKDIESALGKIPLGTYGQCERCGEEIEKKLLDVNPESRWCRNCKQAA